MSEATELPVETPRAWLRYAQGNLGVALREAEYDDPAYFTICFLCQGAAEKFLKAYLIAQGWELIKTHDIVELNEYITAGRYPDDVAVEGIGPDETQEALQAACQIRDAVLARLSTRTGQEE